MLEKFENQKLSDEALDDVTGGGFLKDMFDSWKNKKSGNSGSAVGEKKQGEYHCLSCNNFFSWTLDTDPICPNCREMNNLNRISDLLKTLP